MKKNEFTNKNTKIKEKHSVINFEAYKNEKTEDKFVSSVINILKNNQALLKIFLSR